MCHFPFFYVKIFRENEKLVSSVLRKDTFSGAYPNHISFIPVEYKFHLVNTLLNHCFNLFSSFLKFHHEKFCQKMYIHKNLLINTFKNVLIIYLLKHHKYLMYLKNNFRIILPHLHKMSQIVKTRLSKTMSNHSKFSKLKVIFQTSNTLRNYLHFKDFVS